MYTDPSRDRMDLVRTQTRDDMLEVLGVPAEFQRATEEDMREYYESMDVDTINNTDIFGEGSLKVLTKVMGGHRKRLRKLGRGRDRKFVSSEFVSALHLLEDETLVSMSELHS
jgi:hypothetical protein